MTARREDVDLLMEERVRKLSPKEVDYRSAPAGSAIKCNSCHHGFRRNSDGRMMCELVGSDEIDEDGINPQWRCDWWTSDGDSYPLATEKETEDAVR